MSDKAEGGIEMSETAKDEMLVRFDYYGLSKEQTDRVEKVRTAAKKLVRVILDDRKYVPREMLIALEKLEEVCFWANKGISRDIREITE